MLGIPPNLETRLRDLLARCGPFDSNVALYTTFTDARIAPWRNRISDIASNREERIKALIDALYDQYNSQGENALVLFLHVLCEPICPTDSCHQELATLADELEQVTPTPDTLQWDAVLDRYREWVKHAYGTMRVLGKHEPVSLEGIYTDVYILDKPQAAQRLDLSQLPQDPTQLKTKHERVNGLEFIQQPDNRRLVILGKPGAGKTTFLKYVALQAAERKLDGKVPIFVALREWADLELSLLDFIVAEVGACSMPDAQPLVEQLLDFGEAIVLFDGLDEVNEAGNRRKQLMTALKQFSKQHSNCQILVTCRTAATHTELVEYYNYVEVADFTEEQIAAYAKQWFKDDPTKGDDFYVEIRGDKHLSELAQTPLLLGMLCLTFEELGAFPKRKADLYQEALNVLLEQWDEERGIERDAMRHAELYHSLSTGRKHQMFAQIAYATFEQGEILISQERLEQLILDYLVTIPNMPERIDIDAEAVLKAIEAQHGILVKQAHNVYSFAHLSFHEYFAARYIAERANSGDTEIPLSPHVRDYRWREVILLTVSMLDESIDFFNGFLDTLSATGCDNPKFVDFLTWVQCKASSVDVPYKPAAVRAYYVYFALLCTLALHPSPALSYAPDHALDLARILDHVFAWVYVLDHNQDFDPALALDLYLTLAFYYALNLAYVCYFDFVPTPGLDPDSARLFSLIDDSFRDNAHNSAREITNNLALACSCVQQIGSTELEADPIAFTVPKWDTPKATRQAFAMQLQSFMIEHRNIGHNWGFTIKQAETIERYFNAAHLLAECLNVANISEADRAAIEDRLLLPPGWDESAQEE